MSIITPSTFDPEAPEPIVTPESGRAGAPTVDAAASDSTRGIPRRDMSPSPQEREGLVSVRMHLTTVRYRLDELRQAGEALRRAAHGEATTADVAERSRTAADRAAGTVARDVPALARWRQWCYRLGRVGLLFEHWYTVLSGFFGSPDTLIDRADTAIGTALEWVTLAEGLRSSRLGHEQDGRVLLSNGAMLEYLSADADGDARGARAVRVTPADIATADAYAHLSTLQSFDASIALMSCARLSRGSAAPSLQVFSNRFDRAAKAAVALYDAIERARQSGGEPDVSGLSDVGSPPASAN